MIIELKRSNSIEIERKGKIILIRNLNLDLNP